MRRLIAAASVAALTSGLAVAAPAAAKKPDPPRPDRSVAAAERLTEAVTVNGILRHLREFQVIANQNGGNRASGLPGYDAAADYIEGRLRSAGYQVTRQTFTFPFFRELSPSTLTADGQPVEHDTFTYSGGGDVEGAVVPTNDIVIPATPEPSSTSGCEPDDFTPAPADPVVALVQRGTCDFAVKVDNAVAAGYDAVVIMNEGNPGRTEVVAGTLGSPKTVPVVGVGYEDGVALAGGEAVAQVVTDVESDPDRETFNLIADLPPRGAKKAAGDVLVVGAHLDSVTEGPGINDNGSGSAGILEIALQLAATKLDRRMERPVRFAWWGAEELGLLGAEHYVASLSPQERATIYANLNFDMIGSSNYARLVYDGDGAGGGPAGPPGSAAIKSLFVEYFDRQGLAWEPTAFDGRSDYGPFIDAGIPAGGVFSGADGVKTPEQVSRYGGTAGLPFDPCYHQACDDISAINASALHELGDAAAWGVARLLTSTQGLFPDGSAHPRARHGVGSLGGALGDLAAR